MHQALLFAWQATNISISGGGVINARAGEAGWWRCAGNLSAPPCAGYGRPHLLMFSSVNEVEVAEVTVMNSPDWTLHFSSVTGLHVHGLNVSNPDEPNADGIDIDCTQVSNTKM